MKELLPARELRKWLERDGDFRGDPKLIDRVIREIHGLQNVTATSPPDELSLQGAFVRAGVERRLACVYVGGMTSNMPIAGRTLGQRLQTLTRRRQGVAVQLKWYGGKALPWIGALLLGMVAAWAIAELSMGT